MWILSWLWNTDGGLVRSHPVDTFSVNYYIIGCEEFMILMPYHQGGGCAGGQMHHGKKSVIQVIRRI